MIQSVKLEEFKGKLSNLECLLLRELEDQAQVVAREIAQRLYLEDDKQTILMEPIASPAQLQMVSLLNAAPAEVQDAVKIFRDQLIQIQKEKATTDFRPAKKARLSVWDLTKNADNEMYMNLITEAHVAGDLDAFAYYSRFFVQHLHWNMVRTPCKNGYHVFEEKDLDARLKATDFHIKTTENRQAFRAFLEFLQRESTYRNLFRLIHNTQQEEAETLQNCADYFFGLQSAHADFKPTMKFTRVTGYGQMDDSYARLREQMPEVRALIEQISEADVDVDNGRDEHNVRSFLQGIYSKILRSQYRLVPAAADDDAKVKQTVLDIIKLDPIVTKAALRYFRAGMGREVATYMERLLVQMPELITDSDSLQEDYFDQVFEGRTFDKKRFLLKF